ncbi:glycoside hydrolase family 18 protein [Aspergillus luchuensis CBS 106.47]|uniref:chitinase n=1 Tax=Aspergillus luchuensis (strain CBS 106.47) TaxID=1137211 RepID=A0A1M3T1I8_ASPLC|nr:glycoside hydrolase family 18 protein [Aspergillus luchuensis CBS 106.47]
MRHLRPSFAFPFLSFLTFALSDDISSDSTNPCTEGCCSKVSNVCGYGPDYCSSTNCIAAASTDELAPSWLSAILVSTQAMETSGALTSLASVEQPRTFVATLLLLSQYATALRQRRRLSHTMRVGTLSVPVTPCRQRISQLAVTHINFAFLYIDPDLYTITPMETSQQDLYSRVTALKKRKNDLEVWISIGGWAFNDTGSTANTFSELAASKSKQSTFFESLLSFLDKYGFDGVDLDWEYPVDSDRGGSDADYENYPTFLANLRSALDSADKGYGLTITLPSSYWYLQHFNVAEMAKSVDWFNVMTYDLHGGWDAEDPWIGSVVNAHTNLTEIVSAMDLLWRNDIPPSRVVMGLGFYGRSFTLNDTSCVTAGCPFSTVGKAGDCTNSAGTLSFSEIEAILKDPSRHATQTYDATSSVQIVTFDGNQWVSYDNWASFQAKLDYASSHCIGGTMVWAVSLDVDGTATNGLTGASVVFPGDDGSNGGSEDIYIGPDLWSNATQEISCEPPCTMILPPFPLATPITIDWPAYETTIASSSGGATLTKTTTITVAPFTISEIPFWPITVAESGGNAYLSPMQSIAPPTFGLTLPQTEATFPLFHIDYSATFTTTTSTANATAPAVTTPAAVQSGIVSDCTEFYQAIANDGCAAIATAPDITLAQFIPTATSVQPPGTTIPVLTYSDGEVPSNGGCSSGGDTTGCGKFEWALFGCGGECGFFGCDGGCGLGFCGGGCGLLGCGPGCGAGKCLQEGGGGGSDEEETSTSEACSATATPSVTTVCDYACPDGASTSCATLCTSLTISCEPTGFVNFSHGTVDADALPLTLLEASDDAMTSDAESVASWLNPKYSSMDPVVTSGTTMTASATAPAVTTSPKNTATAISASSCDIKSTSSSSYCSCDGGYGVSLSTKANQAKTTFLVCDVTPALTISTITPTTTSTTSQSTSTTSSVSQSTSTGFALYMTYWSASECPIGLTCEDDGKWNAVMVENLVGDETALPIRGTWNQGGMVDGSQATFCDQTSTFTIDGDDIKG